MGKLLYKNQNNSNEIDKIINFYNQWPYPELHHTDLKTLVDTGFRDKSDPGYNWKKFFQNKIQKTPIDVLVVGCGTYQAGLIAIKNPYATVIGFDASKTSIEMQQLMCDQAELTNIELCTSSILDFQPNKHFDLIVCSGVLHHTADPLNNLKKLRTFLKDDGVLSLSVYNEALRTGVYKIQKLIKLLNLSTSIESASKISNLLHQLQNHSVEKYIPKSSELAYLNNFIDTFFNPRETSYNPLSLFELATNANLFFVDWLNDNYNIETQLSPDHPLYTEIIKLSEIEKAYSIDLIKENNSTIDIVLSKNCQLRK
jgi:2-polyprenyl-3-methyl-5-hydroxy-6-metoxy-1,4-benzoquinol methylase